MWNIPYQYKDKCNSDQFNFKPIFFLNIRQIFKTFLIVNLPKLKHKIGRDQKFVNVIFQGTENFKKKTPERLLNTGLKIFKNLRPG